MEEKDIMKEETTEQPSVLEEVPQTEETAEVAKQPEEQKTPEPPKKKRKKLTKGKIALICVASFILLVGIGVGLFFLIGTLLAEEYVPVEVEFENSRPAYESTFTASELALINSAMTDGASDDTIKEAIAMIYNKANYNKIHNSPQALAVLRGQGSAAVELLGQSPNGSMIVRGIKAQSGDEFYYQKAAKLVECSVPSVQSILEKSLNQQERAYTNGTDDYRLTGTLKGKNAKILKEPETTTVPFVAVGVPEKSKISSYDKENFYQEGFYLDDPREITNFRVTKDYIVLKELKEGEEYIEYDEAGKFYTCRFSLLIEGEGHDDCVEISRRYLRKSANSENLEYEKYDVRFEVWDNGYLKMMHDDEIWAGTAVMAGIDVTTKSQSWYESVIYYDFDEALFNKEDAAAYEGEDWVSRLLAHYLDELDHA